MKNMSHKEAIATFEEVMALLEKRGLSKRDGIQLSANILACAVSDMQSEAEEVEFADLFALVFSKCFKFNQYVGKTNRTQ
jgi:hypothetical protein